MNLEQLHEIYDNNGTLIGYESINPDAVSGYFVRYDENMAVQGFARDARDLIYHYDKSMRFIGYARMEDGVLREYDLNSNVVAYQARTQPDVNVSEGPVQQDNANLTGTRQKAPDAFSFTDPTPPSTPDQGPVSDFTASSGSSAPIYGTSKAYSFSGSDWFGSSSRASLQPEDEVDPRSVDVDQDSGENDLASAGPEERNAAQGYAAPSTFDYRAPASNNAIYDERFNPPNPPVQQWRSATRYDEIVGDDIGDDNDGNGDNGLGAVDNAAHSAQPEQGWRAPYETRQPAYAMRGEVVDDVDEFGNEIGSPEANGQPNSYGYDAGSGYNASYDAEPFRPPLAKRSPFAKKPPLLQRLIARVMPFFSGRTENEEEPLTPDRDDQAGRAAALPAPTRNSAPNAAPNAAQANSAEWPPAQASYPSYNGQPASYTNADPSQADAEERFDPLAEFKLLWQKINYYAGQLLPKRKTREDDPALLDARDALAEEVPTGNPYATSESFVEESSLGNAPMGAAPSAPRMAFLAGLQAFVMAIPAQLAPLPGRMLRASLRAIQTPQWLWWMTATALGTIAFGMVRLFIPPIGNIPSWVYAGLYGLMIGISQWAMLRHRYRTTWHWVVVSALPGVAGALLIPQEMGWLHGRTTHAPFDQIFNLYLLIGVMQWLLLRNLSNRATIWLLLTPVAGAAGWLGYNLGAPAGYIAALSIQGLTLGAVSGLALAPVMEEHRQANLIDLPAAADIVGLITMLSGGLRALSAAISLGGLLEAISGSLSAVTQGGAAQQTPVLLALLSIYPARLFVSLTTMGSALSFRQTQSQSSRNWLIGASVTGILIEIIAQAVLPDIAQPGGSFLFILANLIVLLMLDALTAPPANEPAVHTTLISLSAIGLLSSGLMIFFGSVFLAAHSINVDLMATASMTANEIGFSLSASTLFSLLRVLLSAFAVFVALRLPGERSNGWSEVPMGILAIGAATFIPMLLESSNNTNDMYWLVPIALSGTTLVLGLLRNAASFGGALPAKSKDDESPSRNAPRLVPVGMLICALSVGVILTRNGTWQVIGNDPRFSTLTAKVQDLTSGVTSRISQIQLPKSMSEVQQSTSGLQKTVSDLLTPLQPTPEPTSDWPPPSSSK